MSKRTSKKPTPKMSAEQTMYAVAKAQYETIKAACEAEFTARGLLYTREQSDEDFERVDAAREDIQERLGYWKAIDVRIAAERAMVAWSLAHAKAYSPAHAPEIDELHQRSAKSVVYWEKLVDIAFRLAA